MAIKVAKKLEELKRTKARIKELQEKQTLLEKSIKREEDEEIVRVLRSLKLGHDELAVVLEGIQSGKIGLEELKDAGHSEGEDGDEVKIPRSARNDKEGVRNDNGGVRNIRTQDEWNRESRDQRGFQKNSNNGMEHAGK